MPIYYPLDPLTIPDGELDIVGALSLTGQVTGSAYQFDRGVVGDLTASDRLYAANRIEVGAAGVGWVNFGGTYISVLGSGLTQNGEWYIVNDAGTGDGARTYFASQNSRNLVFIPVAGFNTVVSSSLRATGAVTASNGISVTSGREVFAVPAVSQTLSAAQLTASLDLSAGNSFKLTTLTAQTLLNVSNLVAGQSFYLQITNGVLNGTLTFPAAMKFPANTVKTISGASASVSTVEGFCYDGSTLNCWLATGSA